MRKLALVLLLFAAIARADEPETVMVTAKAKPGHEAQLESVLKKHWATIKRLDLVTTDEHQLFRSDGGVYIDIFTWKSGAIPDNPPAEVLGVWKEMNDAAAKLEIVQITRVHVE